MSNPKVTILFDSYEDYLENRYNLFINAFPDLQNINSIAYSQLIDLQQNLKEKEAEDALLHPYTDGQYSNLFDILDEIVFLKLLELDLNTFSSYKEIGQEYPDCILEPEGNYYSLSVVFNNKSLFSVKLYGYK